MTALYVFLAVLALGASAMYASSGEWIASAFYSLAACGFSVSAAWRYVE